MITTCEELIEWINEAKTSLNCPIEAPICLHDELGNIYTIDTPFKCAQMIDTKGEKETIEMLSLPIVLRKCKAATLERMN